MVILRVAIAIVGIGIDIGHFSVIVSTSISQPCMSGSCRGVLGTTFGGESKNVEKIVQKRQNLKESMLH